MPPGPPEAAAALALYLRPAWLLLNAGPALIATDAESGRELTLTGRARAEVLGAWEPGARPTLGALGRLSGDVRALADALDRAAPEPLTRASLLRGPGFELLFVELTARCNERCVHCYAESSPEREEQLPQPIIDAALEDGRRLGFSAVQLTGGDPLIAPTLVPSVRRARALDYELVEVYTNGLALDEALYRELAPHGTSFAFSFYSHDPVVHDAITRTHDSQRRTLRAIERALAGGSPVRVSVVVMESNAEGLARTAALLGEVGVAADRIRVDYQRGVGRGSATDHAVADPGELGVGGHQAARRQPFQGKACVAADGSVYPCIFTRSHRLGSVYDTPLAEILGAPAALRLPTGAALGEPSRPLVDHERLAAQLTCWECRVRSALLDPEQLVQLHSQGET